MVSDKSELKVTSGKLERNKGSRKGPRVLNHKCTVFKSKADLVKD